MFICVIGSERSEVRAGAELRLAPAAKGTVLGTVSPL